jgi:hypothetical protein
VRWGCGLFTHDRLGDKNELETNFVE